MADQGFEAVIAEAAQLGMAVARFTATWDAFALEVRARQPATTASAEPDSLGPVRDAMHQYEAAVAAGQHGGVAAAQFVDAVYAVLTPMPPERVVDVIETGEAQPLQWEPEKADADGWGD